MTCDSVRCIQGSIKHPRATGDCESSSYQIFHKVV